jgi:hypothetical protein
MLFAPSIQSNSWEEFEIHPRNLLASIQRFSFNIIENLLWLDEDLVY